jgi:hypothetical protein
VHRRPVRNSTLSVSAQTRHSPPITVPSKSPVRTIGALRRGAIDDVPNTAGVYFVTRPPRIAIRLRHRSPAGWFKGRNPTIPAAELRRRLAANPYTLYIGKAAGTSSRSTLRARIRAYLRHGEGHRAGHWGGRAIWQIAPSDKLTITWIPTTPARARTLERRLLRDFKELFGVYPFANHVG